MRAHTASVSVVTGAAGFVGRALTRRLAADGDTVVGIDRVAWTPPPGVTAHVVDGDDALGQALAGVRPDHVYALAGGRMTHGGLAAHLVMNLVPLAALLEAIDGSGAGVVFASSGEVYGAAPVPFREDGPTTPLTPYGLAKLACEQLGFAWARGGAMRFAAARLAVVYGPGQRGEMFVPSLVRALARGERFAMSPGEQWRDFVHVDDAVEALRALAHAPEAGGACWNVGTGSGVQLREVAALAQAAHTALAGAAGAAGAIVPGARPYRENEVMDYRFDTARMRALGRWIPRVPLDQGLRDTLEWAIMEQHGDARAMGGAPAPAASDRSADAAGPG